MKYFFFADKQDKLNVLDFIYDQMALQVFDIYSPYGQEISQYKSTSEILSRYDLENGVQWSIGLNLWSPGFGGQLNVRKIALNPRHCNGHTFRYITEGWGLIQLYFGGLKDNTLYNSNIGHFNEKGAMKWEGSNPEKGKVDLWDWKSVEQTSGKLKYHIHTKMAVRKIGSYGVLQGADDLSKSGVKIGGE